MKANIWVEASINKNLWPHLVEDWKNDRDAYCEQLAQSSQHGFFDGVLVVSEWPSGDGVLLLKESEESIESAKKQLHQQMHKYLDGAIKRYGVDHVSQVAVFVRAIPVDEFKRKVALSSDSARV